MRNRDRGQRGAYEGRNTKAISHRIDLLVCVATKNRASLDWLGNPRPVHLPHAARTERCEDLIVGGTLFMSPSLGEFGFVVVIRNSRITLGA